MTKLRRGFKAEANAHSLALRRELELQHHAPLSPWRLAEFLEVPVIPLSDLAPRAPAGVKHLLGKGQECFSAVTIFVGRHGRRRAIFHNDSHSMARQAANLAHELAHAILGHAPTPHFQIHSVEEEEAKWLGPTLLIPNEAALHIVESKMSMDSAAELYGVSRRLLEMRLNVSGARIRLARRHKRSY
jgi:hypothetical protein